MTTIPKEWPIETDDQVEALASECGWRNRRYMTTGDYAIWCEQMRRFARLASLGAGTVAQEPDGNRTVAIGEETISLLRRGMSVSAGRIYLLPASDLTAPAQEPVAKQWCAYEDGEQRTGWAPDGYGDRAGWAAIAKRIPEKYQIVTRDLYATPQPAAVAVPEVAVLTQLGNAVLAQAPIEATEFMGVSLSDIRSALTAPASEPAPKVVEDDGFAKLQEYFLAAEDVFEYGEAQAPTWMIRRLHASRAALASQEKKG